jgi:hypothetical protein
VSTEGREEDSRVPTGSNDRESFMADAIVKAKFGDEMERPSAKRRLNPMSAAIHDAYR